jgi:hypothetical protein
VLANIELGYLIQKESRGLSWSGRFAHRVCLISHRSCIKPRGMTYRLRFSRYSHGEDLNTEEWHALQQKGHLHRCV